MIVVLAAALAFALQEEVQLSVLFFGPLYFVPEENAPADCAARAAEITEPLFAALMESEKSAFPTIPSHRR